MVAHPGVDAAQIAARADGARIVRRKRVENFRLDGAFHTLLTSKNAPWQLKPAPNADIHQRPPGTSRNARSRTK